MIAILKILYPFIMMLPLGQIVSLIFSWLASKYGDGFMKWVLELVARNAQKIELGTMSKAEAEKRNIELIQTATAQSPGISTNLAKIINEVAYAKWLSDNRPAEFKKRMNRFISGGKKAQRYSETDFMRLYTSRPDKKP